MAYHGMAWHCWHGMAWPPWHGFDKISLAQLCTAQLSTAAAMAPAPSLCVLHPNLPPAPVPCAQPDPCIQSNPCTLHPIPPQCHTRRGLPAPCLGVLTHVGQSEAPVSLQRQLDVSAGPRDDPCANWGSTGVAGGTVVSPKPEGLAQVAYILFYFACIAVTSI